MRKTNLYYNNYLSNCDLINKYNCENIYKIPKIESIVIDFPIHQISTVFDNSSNLKNVTLKSYFLFYILFYFKPYINYKSVKLQDKNYSLKFKFSNASQIHNFIHTFFMNYNSNSFFNFFFNTSKLSLFSLKEKKALKNFPKYNNILESKINFLNLNTKLKKKTTNLNFKSPVFCFFNLDFYMNNLFENINLKEIFFFINVVIENYEPINIKNYPTFWIFNNYQKK